MVQEELTELFTFQMTAREKELLRTLAYEQGATLSGLLRKLIRDATRDVRTDNDARTALYATR